MAGIGGRRWAKFAKYLSRLDVRVHVICTPHLEESSSLWTKDVIHNPNIIRHEVPSGYPNWNPSNHLFGKIRNKLTYWRLLASTQGTPYDQSIFWHAGVRKKATEILQNQEIQHMILTGAPFHQFYHLGKLKNQFPDLKLILDFRDPWTSGTAYGMSEISPKRLAYERSIEQEALRTADIVLGPYALPHLLGDAMSKSNTTAIPHIIPHAFDPEDIADISSSLTKKDETIRLIYGGSLYPGTETYLTQLATSLKALQQTQPSALEKWEFSFYTPETQRAAIFQGLPESTVRFFAPIPHRDILQKVSEADICLLFLNEEKKHFRTTKFAEFSTLKRPFLLFGPTGEVADFIHQNKIGHTISNPNFRQQDLLAGIQQLLKPNAFHPDFQSQQYSYPAVTDMLIRLLDVQQPSQKTKQIHV